LLLIQFLSIYAIYNTQLFKLNVTIRFTRILALVTMNASRQLTQACMSSGMVSCSDQSINCILMRRTKHFMFKRNDCEVNDLAKP